jgi:hypothetical protein
LLREFADVFAWAYEDLKTYYTSVIEHKIPLKEEARPFKTEAETDKSYAATCHGEGGEEATKCSDYCPLEIL